MLMGGKWCLFWAISRNLDLLNDEVRVTIFTKIFFWAEVKINFDNFI